jgi:hypothetical protein
MNVSRHRFTQPEGTRPIWQLCATLFETPKGQENISDAGVQSTNFLGLQPTSTDLKNTKIPFKLYNC